MSESLCDARFGVDVGRASARRSVRSLRDAGRLPALAEDAQASQRRGSDYFGIAKSTP